MRRFWVAAGLWMMTFAGFAQQELEMATYYYQEQAYEQAILYLEPLWKKNKSNTVYDLYYASLLGLNDFDGAYELVNYRLKQRGNRSAAYVDLGKLYLHFDREAEARTAFLEALERLEPGKNQAIQLANLFVELKEYGLALQVYEKALQQGVPDLEYSMAELKGLQGDYPGMLQAYMDLLHQRPTYLRAVQNNIDRNLRIHESPERATLVRQALIRAAQKYPEDIIFPEMLLWYHNSVQDFAGALVHAKSLDLRFGEQGQRVIDLAYTSARNEDFTTAEACFTYVADTWPQGPYFITSRTESMRLATARVLQQKPPNRTELQALSQRYGDLLATLQLGPETAMLAKDWAHLRAFFLDDRQGAIELLDQALLVPGLVTKVAATCKLELGDIYVLDDNIWEASLLFSQVELDFKDDPVGHEAKFRNARVSYFGGDFDWAQAQLDALKASTSKLISNNAIELSLLITDNYALDTLPDAMRQYAQADLLALQLRYDDAAALLDDLLIRWPGHALTDNILLQKARWARELGRFDQALTLLEEISTLHFHDVLADDALYLRAQILEQDLQRPLDALPLYEQLLFEFPGSLYVTEARKKFRDLTPPTP
jgi:tetratricopeptide (TPR) repeat protein